MAKKKSWVMYESWIPLFESLPNDKAGELIKAICAYKKGEGDPEWTLDPVLTSVFRMIKETLDIDATKYAEVCKTRSESASKAYASKRKQMLANACKSKQKDASRVESESDSESDSESVFDSDNVSPSEIKRVRFVPPTVEEVREYCIERKNNVDADNFVNFYSAKGWMVGKNKMKDWKACVRTWEKNRNDKPSVSNAKIHNFEERRYDYGALEKMLIKN